MQLTRYFFAKKKGIITIYEMSVKLRDLIFFIFYLNRNIQRTQLATKFRVYSSVRSALRSCNLLRVDSCNMQMCIFKIKNHFKGVIQPNFYVINFSEICNLQ